MKRQIHTDNAQGQQALQAIRALVSEDMRAVDTLIRRKLHSEIALIDQLSNYILNSGGKRLRPILVLLSANCFARCTDQGLALAAIVEFIHTATLLHDDVVDASLLRRGRETANQRWGNEASVLVGDFLYSRAFQMMVEVNSMRMMSLIADATNKIAEGEVQQLINRHDPDTTEQRYLQVIQNKTARLFEVAAQVGAVITGQNEQVEQAMARYGRHLGIAYQLIDDALDYSASVDNIGKHTGADLAGGKPTLPLLYALQHCPDEQAELLRRALKEGGLQQLEQVHAALRATDAIGHTHERACQEAVYAVQALDGIPQSEYLEALRTLARFVTERTC